MNQHPSIVSLHQLQRLWEEIYYSDDKVDPVELAKLAALISIAENVAMLVKLAEFKKA